MIDQESPQRELFKKLVEAGELLAWISEADGRCSYLSTAWVQFTGTRPSETSAFEWLSAVHIEDQPRVMTAFLTANNARAPYAANHRLRRRGGDYSLVWAYGLPQFDNAGTYLGFFGTTTAQEHYRERQLQLRKLEMPSSVRKLTERERQVLKLIAGGNTSDTIGEMLGISSKTVDVHIGNASTKLGAANRVNAVVKAAQFGEIDL